MQEYLTRGRTFRVKLTAFNMLLFCLKGDSFKDEPSAFPQSFDFLLTIFKYGGELRLI